MVGQPFAALLRSPTTQPYQERIHHAARCTAARSDIPHSPDAKVHTLDQGHVTICHNPSVHRTPCGPGVRTHMVQGGQRVHHPTGVQRRCVSMCAPARAARVGAQPPAPTRSKTCPLPTGHKAGSAARSPDVYPACSAKTARLEKPRTKGDLRGRIKHASHPRPRAFRQN